MSSWIEWKGGAMPVDGDQVVEVRLRDEVSDTRRASDLYWDYRIPWPDQIVAYRLARTTDGDK